MKLACNLFGHSYELNEKLEKKSYFKYSCTRCENQTDYVDRDRWENTFWQSEYFDVIKVIFWFLLGTIIFILLIVGLISVIGYNSCQQYSKFGVDAVWNFWTGCMANHPKFGYIPVEEYFRTLNINLP
jgi:hypothetical protein